MLLKIKEVVDLVGHLPPVGSFFKNSKLYWREIQNYLNFFLQLKSLNLTSKSTLNKQLRNFLLSISLLVHQMNFNVVEMVIFFRFFLSKQRSKYLRKRTFFKIFFPLGGCQGSIPQLGFTYTQLFGLVSEADYPYTSGNVSI